MEKRDSETSLKGRILLMDDDPLISTVAAKMIMSLGHQVVTVPGGEELLKTYTEAKEQGAAFDLLILDLTIPQGMGGAETLAKVRAFDPGVKALVSSGHTHDPVVEGFQKYGFIGVINKPYRLEELKQAIQEALS